jgi:hypothetical protein
MKQKTLHISFTKDDDDLYNEIMRQSSRNYIPASTLARIWMRNGIAQSKQTKGFLE